MRGGVIGVAQMGPIAKSETRPQVVKRLIDMLKEAKGRNCRFVVFPELALTTFFPRWVYQLGDPELEAFFETEMPGPDTRPLFETAAELGIGFYLGYADETGEGSGLGFTRNEVLSMGDGEAEVLAALDRGIAAVQEFDAEALVVSLGFDMAADDPLAAVQVYAEGFAEMARRIAAMGLPTVLIQEGGYLGPSLRTNAEAFLTTFRDSL